MEDNKKLIDSILELKQILLKVKLKLASGDTSLLNKFRKLKKDVARLNTKINAKNIKQKKNC